MNRKGNNKAAENTASADKEFYSYSDLQKIFNIKYSTLAAMKRRGIFVKGRDFVKIGTNVRFKPELVERMKREGIE